MTRPVPALDSSLLEPKRLQICGALGVIDEMEFGTLRDLLGVADSVMSKHLKTLEDGGYVVTRKQKAGDTGRPRTWVKLTKAGRVAFLGHVAELRRLAQDVAAPTS